MSICIRTGRKGHTGRTHAHMHRYTHVYAHHMCTTCVCAAGCKVRLVAVEGMQQMVSEVTRQSTASYDLRSMVMEALMGRLADTKRPLRHAAAKSLQLLGDEDWLAVFPTQDEPPASAVLTASQRPEARSRRGTLALPQHSPYASHQTSLRLRNYCSRCWSSRMPTTAGRRRS